MQVKSIAECSKGSILQYFRPSFVIKIFVLSIFEWSLKTGFIVFSVSVEELEEDTALVEVGAQLVFNAHSQLLGKGFALSRPPTIMQALEGSLPFCWQSNERSFLKDFVACSMGTSGGRLARYSQQLLNTTLL